MLERRKAIYLLGFLVSIVASLIVYSHRQPFNTDGLIYLNTAQAYLSGGLHAAMHSFKWPFYSILIALFSKFTTLTLLSSTYVLNTLLDAVTVVAFLLLLRQIGATQRQQLIGLLVILCFSQYIHIYGYIVRGHGYYACYLLAIWSLIRFFDTENYFYAIAWGVLSIAAALFRIEGCVILAMLPIAGLFQPNKSILRKMQNVLLSYSLLVFAILFIIGMLLFRNNFSLQHLGRVNQLLQYTNIVQVIIQHIHAQDARLVSVFPFEARGQIKYIFTFGMIGLFISYLVATVTPFFTLLAGYAIFKKLIPWSWSAKFVIAWAIIINGIIMISFTLTNFFISHRFLMLMSFLILLAVPFALENIYFAWRNKTPTFIGRVWLFPVMLLILIYMLIAALGHFGPSKTYVLNAADWLRSNTLKTARLYTNVAPLCFYSERPGSAFPRDFWDSKRTMTSFYKSKLIGYKYVALKIKRHDKGEYNKVIAHLHRQPLKIFGNHRGDKIYLFKMS